MDAQARLQLELEISTIGRDGTAENIDWETGEIVEREEAPTWLVDASEVPDTAPEPFGRWLLAQKSREDWIDDLAAAARRDPGFPKDGTADEVRARMNKLGVAEAEVYEQIDDAERAWRVLRPDEIRG